MVESDLRDEDFSSTDRRRWLTEGTSVADDKAPSSDPDSGGTLMVMNRSNQGWQTSVKAGKTEAGQAGDVTVPNRRG